MTRQNLAALTATAGLVGTGAVIVGALASSFPIMGIGATAGVLAAATNVRQMGVRQPRATTGASREAAQLQTVAEGIAASGS